MIVFEKIYCVHYLIPSFRNPPEADIRNPEKTTESWIPDPGGSGMTINGFRRAGLRAGRKS